MNMAVNSVHTSAARTDAVSSSPASDNAESADLFDAVLAEGLDAEEAAATDEAAPVIDVEQLSAAAPDPLLAVLLDEAAKTVESGESDDDEAEISSFDVSVIALAPSAPVQTEPNEEIAAPDVEDEIPVEIVEDGLALATAGGTTASEETIEAQTGDALLEGAEINVSPAGEAVAKDATPIADLGPKTDDSDEDETPEISEPDADEAATDEPVEGAVDDETIPPERHGEPVQSKGSAHRSERGEYALHEIARGGRTENLPREVRAAGHVDSHASFSPEHETAIEAPDQRTADGGKPMIDALERVVQPHEAVTHAGNVAGASARSDAMEQPRPTVENRPLNENHFVDNVVRHCRLLTRPDGSSEIRLNLQPPDLGTVSLRLTLKNDRLQGRIELDNTDLRQAVETLIPRIRESLASEGLNLDRFDVDTRRQAESQTGGQSGTQSEQNSRGMRDGNASATSDAQEDPRVRISVRTPEGVMDFTV